MQSTPYRPVIGSMRHKSLTSILLLPLAPRCYELASFIDFASLKVLHDSFPTLIDSIFNLQTGGPGWNIRTITSFQPCEFETLNTFFSPIGGPMFRLLYRLASEPLRYFVPFSYLPRKLQLMLISGTYSPFYNGRISIDPFRQQILGLTLNSIEYFLFHFAMYGTISYRQLFYTCVRNASDNERVMTLYLVLACEYLIFFLPTGPDGILVPRNMDKLMKSVKGMVAPSTMPTKRIKYLLPQRLQHHIPVEELEPSQTARIAQKHSESTMYIFLDVWLGMNVEELRELPSPELIRCIRVLVKQLHRFGQCVDKKMTAPVAALRNATQPLMAAYVPAFINAIFVRWPMDDSLADVLEMWLSYIQPWRYHPLEGKLNAQMIAERYETFIAHNLHVYTQTFIKLLHRLLHSDMMTLRNASIAFRLCRVFSQGQLLELLQQLEHERFSGTPNHTQSPLGRSLSPSLLVASAIWPASRYPYFANRTMFADHSPYEMLFTEDTMQHLRSLLAKTRRAIKQTEDMLEYLQRKKPQPWLLTLFWRNKEREELLRKTQDVLIRLEFVANTLEHRFGLGDGDDPRRVVSAFALDTSGFGLGNSLTLSVEDWYDPALLPIAASENAFLVRFLYLVSSKLTLMFGREIQALWEREGPLGTVVRQLLMPPKTVLRFVRDESGAKFLSAEYLPARVDLRFLASYVAIVCIGSALLFGLLVFGAPSYGLVLLLALNVLQRWLRKSF